MGYQYSIIGIFEPLPTYFKNNSEVKCRVLDKDRKSIDEVVDFY